LFGCDDTTPAVTDVPVVLKDIPADAVADVGNRGDVGNPIDVPMTVDVPSGGRVVINEVQAAGDDWVELTNVGGAPVDLGGLVLADSDTSADGGAPRLTDGLTFPVGTSLAPGQYLLVVADLSDAGTGQQMTCLGDGGPTSCYHAGFGISALRGERIYLIGAGGAEVATADYPPPTPSRRGAPGDDSRTALAPLRPPRRPRVRATRRRDCPLRRALLEGARAPSKP
jgi:hypothetical protein